MNPIIRRGLPAVIAGVVAIAASGCDETSKTGTAPTAPAASSAAPKEDPQVRRALVRKDADAFLKSYQEAYAKLEKDQTTAYWTAANSGKKEDFDQVEKTELAIKMFHSDAKQYMRLQELLKQRAELEPLTVRQLEVAELAFKGNQLTPDVLEKMVKASTDIEKTFNTFRGDLGGKKLSNNELLEKLAKERNGKKRQALWEALKQVGDQVGPKLIALAKIRNEAAKKLGFANYWDMQVRLQEHEPARLLAIFDELEKLTNEPFAKMKSDLDAELATKFKIKPEEMMPWHYDNPFFQAPPPSAKVDLDEFFKGKKKEDIVAIAKKFYQDIDIDIDPLVERSDLYEREGKDQHAFCIAIDRQGDVRMLLNVKPTNEWMGTMLHELGHAVYYQKLDYGLPYNLREASHIFTTEAIAMLFGALAANPTWLVTYGDADAKRVEKVQDAILEQRKREQLIFTRWTLVMLNFEKALYENPDQDLNKLWWDTVEKYQMLKRPEGRNAADWASKPHFTIAPVYYHNYMLGELFAAQLRATFAKMAKHEGPTSTLSFNGRKDFGAFLDTKIFKPGMRTKWPEFVKTATGEDLTAKYFATEVK